MRHGIPMFSITRKQKPCPYYEKLIHIFGTDCATGRSSLAPADILEEVNQNQTNIEAGEVSATKSHSTQKKKKRQDEVLSAGLDKFAESFKEVMQTSNEQTRLLIQSMQSKDDKKDK